MRNRESGVYKITNLITGDFYIGSTVDLKRRKRQHFNNHKNSSGKLLQKDMFKYGSNNFLFEILELVAVGHLVNREQWYIDSLKPTYNIYKKVLPTNAGWIPPETHLNHLKNIGFKSGVPSRFVRKVKAYQIDINGELIKEWDCSQDAEEALGLYKGSVCRVLSGEYSHTRGFFFTKTPPII